MKSATTGAVIGGFVGGPAGAVGGKLMADKIITDVDSAIHGKLKPYGAAKLGQTSDVGENFDEVIDLVLQLKSKVSNSSSKCFKL